MKKKSKIERLLRFIAQSENGRTFMEINYYVAIVLFKISTLEYKQNKKKYSGLYANVLYSTGNRAGILQRFCKKIDGRWCVVKEIKPPFTRVIMGQCKWNRLLRSCKNCENSKNGRYSYLPRSECETCKIRLKIRNEALIAD